MQFRLTRGWWFVLILAALATPLQAGLFKRCRAPRPDNTPYTPAERSYVVVLPVHGAVGQDDSAGQYGAGCAGNANPYPWRQQRLGVPVYPWGWFGAKRSPAAVSHTGYYGTYRDRSYRRGH